VAAICQDDSVATVEGAADADGGRLLAVVAEHDA